MANTDTATVTREVSKEMPTARYPEPYSTSTSVGIYVITIP